jgi:hypothetical protein
LARIWLLAAWMALGAGCARGKFADELDAGERPPGSGAPEGGPGGDAPCASLEAGACDPDAKGSVYVSTAGNDNNSGLTPDRPLRTLDAAIQQASDCAAGPCNVRIAQGTYDESIAILNGVHLFGGYNASFGLRDPVTYAVTITSHESHTVIADGLSVPTVLDGLTISGAILDTNDGASSYALWVNDSDSMLTLSRVNLHAGAGAVGSAGVDGQVVACDASGGLGGEATDCDSQAGQPGSAAGDPTHGGEGGGGGDNNCPDACPSINRDAISDGETGHAGEAGTHGSRGVAATEQAGSFEGGGWRGTPGTPGARGQHGTGGGGGGSGGTKRIRACFGCGTLLGGHGGNGARGGCGGGGGGQGGPGGGAFALVVVDSTVSLETVTLRGGTGGPGGAGGRGADGAPGGELEGDVRSDGNMAHCGAIDYWSGNGAPGGPGGAGGHGGGGAGGLGGAAITLVTAGSGAVLKLAEVAISAGEPGAGGAGGISSGARGDQGKPGFAAPERAYE